VALQIRTSERPSREAIRYRGFSERHAAAILSAALAGLRAGSTMLCRVATTLLATTIAQVSAQRAYRGRIAAASRDHAGGRRTDCRAIHVQRDAPGHLRDVRLTEAGRCALIASRGAVIACFHDRDLLGEHDFSAA
jgi:hypothetical protein